MRHRRTLLSYSFLIALLYGCSHLTPAQQTLWALNVYEAQYDLYLEQVINPMVGTELKGTLKADPFLIKGDYLNPDLTEEQWKVLRVKKDILVELKPLILMAAEYQQPGKVPPAEARKKMTELINRLVELAED